MYPFFHLHIFTDFTLLMLFNNQNTCYSVVYLFRSVFTSRGFHITKSYRVTTSGHASHLAIVFILGHAV